jgi:uncharacterized damage-inducible protein DinB
MASTSAATHLREQFQPILSGEAWYGPAVMEILNGINAEMALKRPFKNTHNIWEILIHMTVWTDIVRGRLGGATFIPTPEEDWPPILDTSEDAWRATVMGFQTSWELLMRKIDTLTEEQINTTILAIEFSNKPFSVATLLHGIIQHTTYHAGQIALIKKGLSA